MQGKGRATNFMSGGQRRTKARSPKRGAQWARRERGRGSVTALGRGHEGGAEGRWVHDDAIPSVEISIAGGVEEMVCHSNYRNFFYFLLFLFISFKFVC